MKRNFLAKLSEKYPKPSFLQVFLTTSYVNLNSVLQELRHSNFKKIDKTKLEPRLEKILCTSEKSRLETSCASIIQGRSMKKEMVACKIFN